MENLNLSQDGLTIQPFRIQSEDAMLYVESTGVNTLTFYLSTDGEDFTQWSRTKSMTDYIHEPMHDMIKGSFMKIVCTGQMSNPKIMWS